MGSLGLTGIYIQSKLFFSLKTVDGIDGKGIFLSVIRQRVLECLFAVGWVTGKVSSL